MNSCQTLVQNKLVPKKDNKERSKVNNRVCLRERDGERRRETEREGERGREMEREGESVRESGSKGERGGEKGRERKIED